MSISIKKYITLIFSLVLILNCDVVFPAAAQKDIVLMIDNSGSMKKNDPHFLTKTTLTEFVQNLSEDTQVALLIFDHNINLTLPSTLVTQTAKDNILANFDKIDFKGRLTKLPAAVERAIYELKIKGRKEAEKSIIFITDGIVDTGDKARDRDKARWLRENLSEDAARAGIKIFGIALSDQADFELIQSLAQKTGGEYFRAFTAEDIPQIFSKIDSLIVKIQPEPAIPPPTPLPRTKPNTEVVKPQKPVKSLAKPELPTPKIVPPIEKRTPRLMIILAGLIALTVIALATLFILKSKKRKASRASEFDRHSTDIFIRRATLKDLAGVTEQNTYEITEKAIRIGRMPQYEGTTINHIVINKNTISHQHAIIECRDQSFWVIDQGSTNGTFVNGQKVIGEMPLKHGDIIVFDVYEFEFTMPEISDADLDETVFRDPEATLDKQT